MSTEFLLYALNQIDAAYLEETQVVPPNHRLRHGYGIAACAAFILICVFAIPVWMDMSIPQQSAPVTIDRGSIIINNRDSVKVRKGVESSQQIADDVCADSRQWTDAQVSAYFGTEITPPYVPSYLHPSGYYGGNILLYHSDGTLLCDAVHRGFYQDDYRNGTQKNVGNAITVKGFRLTAYRVNDALDCAIVYDRQSLQPTEINGVNVYFAGRQITDEKIIDPSDTCTAYTVNFEKDGVSYELHADRLPLDEVIKITASILFQTEQIVVE